MEYPYPVLRHFNAAANSAEEEELNDFTVGSEGTTPFSV